MKKRLFHCCLGISIALVAVLLLPNQGRTQKAAGNKGKVSKPAAKAATIAPLTESRIVGDVTAAVDRALVYLSSKQRPNGSWDDNQAPNALAILSFLGRGHVPRRGPYRDIVEKAKNQLLRSQNDKGLFVSKRKAGSGPMYTQGLCTLANAELYGMDPDPKVEQCLRRAVDLIVRSQSPSGGWRYQPRPGQQDVSVTVMQVVALRAANNAEVPIPEKTFQKAIAYVKSCADPKGGFGYNGRSRKTAMTAAGILSLQLAGDYNDPALPKALDYLGSLPVKWSAAGGIGYYYYFHYYAMQAQYQAGGKRWNEWHPRVRELFLSKQNADGSWDIPPGSSEKAGTVGINKVYWTSMATLVLEVYMHFLPAYQR